MGRLPFDPDKIKHKARGLSPEGPSVPGASAQGSDAVSVSAFARMIERAVAGAFPTKVVVRGEVSGARHRTHYYFNLKDENAVIGAVMFASAAKRSAVKPTDGRTILATGKLEYYAPQGRLSLIVESIAEDGAGSLEVQFRALCDDLRARGWFDPDAKRPIPAFPKRIAVLTAAGSAAEHDVLDTAAQRCPAVELVMVDVPVQGERAAAAIARTIGSASRAAGRLGLDAILLTRGGGSVEDLWCFNDPRLADAIHRCELPIVAAIGHESDTTIAELVADHRSATPTQAIVRLTPDRAALSQQLESLGSRRARAIGHRLEAEDRRLDSIARRPIMADPAAVIGIQHDRVARLCERMAASVVARLAATRRDIQSLELRLERHRPSSALGRQRDTLDHLARELRAAARGRLAESSRVVEGTAGILHAIDPTAVLERGYSITTRDDGTVIRKPAQVRPGDRIQTRLATGQIASIIDGGPTSESQPAEQAADRAEPATSRIPPRRPKRGTDDVPQMDLFSPDE